MRITTILATVAIAAIALPASAASLLTTAGGYTGPTLVIPNVGYVFTAGPAAFAGGITYSSTSSFSVYGFGGYGLDANGYSSITPIIGTNDGTSTITLTFATAVSMFGGGFNYAINSGGGLYGSNPTIAAYDASNVLIASYDLFTLAPISTPFAVDAFAFRGIDGGGTMIKSFTITGSYIIMAGSAVPEPASWAMLIAGFGLTGAAMRRRRTGVAAA